MQFEIETETGEKIVDFSLVKYHEPIAPPITKSPIPIKNDKSQKLT